MISAPVSVASSIGEAGGLARAALERQSGECAWCGDPLERRIFTVMLTERRIPKSVGVVAVVCSHCVHSFSKAVQRPERLADAVHADAVARGCLSALAHPDLNRPRKQRTKAARRVREELVDLVNHLWPRTDVDALAAMREALELVGHHSSTLARLERLSRDGDGLCVWCSEPMSLSGARRDRRRITVEHLVPKSVGGTYLADNLLGAHARCNSARGDVAPADWTAVCLEHGMRVLHGRVADRLRRLLAAPTYETLHPYLSEQLERLDGLSGPFETVDARIALERIVAERAVSDRRRRLADSERIRARLRVPTAAQM